MVFTKLRKLGTLSSNIYMFFLCVLVMTFLFIGQKLWQMVLYVHLCLWKDVYNGVDMGSDALGREVCYHRQKIILSRLCTFRTIEI